MHSLLTSGENLIELAAVLSFYLLINGTLLFQRGQTLGKLLLGIAIVNRNGVKPSAQTLWFRILFFWCVPYIPFVGSLLGLINICFIFGNEGRCLHDLIASTKVVKVQKR